MSVKIRLQPVLKNRRTGLRFKDVNVDENILEKPVRKDLDCIKNRINNLFMWEQGTRVLFPEYGNILEKIKYEPLNEETVKNVEALIIEMFSYEPEVSIKSINIEPDPDQNELRIKVIYLVPELNVSSRIDLEVAVAGGISEGGASAGGGGSSGGGGGY